MRSKLPREVVCYLCGKPISDPSEKSRDHVIPQGWFTAPLPPNLPTAYAHKVCNSGLSDAEERIRNIWSRAYGHEPGGFQKAMEKGERSLQPRPRVIERGYYRTPSGLFREAAIVVPNHADVEIVFGKITRGLFLKECGLFLPIHIPMKVQAVPEKTAGAFIETFVRDHGRRIREIGPQFSWTNALPAEAPEDGAWLFIAFKVGVIVVLTGKIALAYELPSASGIAIRPWW